MAGTANESRKGRECKKSVSCGTQFKRAAFGHMWERVDDTGDWKVGARVRAFRRSEAIGGAMSSLIYRCIVVWSRPACRRRLLIASLLVAALVTAIHRLLPGHGVNFWLPFHAAIPAAVFSWGAWSSGSRRFDLSLVGHGLLVVCAVALGFGLINGRKVAWELAALLNFLTPLMVSTLGATAAVRGLAGQTFRVSDPTPNASEDESQLLD